MTYAERILDYLWSGAPDGATNSQMADRLSIRSHQTVYMLTQDLRYKGLIRGEQRGREWVFYGVEEPGGSSSPLVTLGQRTGASDTRGPMAFEALAQRVLTAHFGTDLSPGTVPAVRKRFDLVSSDRRIVGNAMFYSRVGGVVLPSAKFSIIAEHVWLLEKTMAPTTFLVFGNDRQVPLWWLERYGNLVLGVTFYFLTQDGHLEVLPCPDY